MAMIGQAALGYLPLAILAIMIAAPVTALLLAASDELCTLISTAAGSTPGAALSKLRWATGRRCSAGRPSSRSSSALITIAAAVTLWIELLIRSAAVYVIVLMLPVLFAALVWPARRVWAMRGVELLVALILSKFAIVAVLSLGASAIGQGILGGIRTVAGATLVLLAAFSPWAVLRLIPLHELAAGAAAWTPHLRHPFSSALGPATDRAEERELEGRPRDEPGRHPRGRRDAARPARLRGPPGAGRGAHGCGWRPSETGTQDGGSDGSRTVVCNAPIRPAGRTEQFRTAPPDPLVHAAPGEAPDSDSDGPPPDDPPTPPQRPEPEHEFFRESIRFGDDFAFRPPEPGGVAPRPIEDEPTADAEPERVDPPMPPGDEHGTGPL